MNYLYLEKNILHNFEEIKQKLPNIKQSEKDLKFVQEKYDYIIKELDDKIFRIFEEFTQSTLVLIPRISIQLQYRLDQAEFYIEYFERNLKTENKFFIEIKNLHAELLGIYSQQITKNADQKLKLLQSALQHLQQSIDIIIKPHNQKKYQFMVYNISIVIYKLIKKFFISSFMQHFTKVILQIHDMLIKADNVEHNWKGYFSWILYNCLLDQQSDQEAQQILNILWKNSEQDNYDFHELLFKQRVNICKKFPKMLDQIRKELKDSKDKKQKFVFKIQEFKMGFIQENQVDKEINQLIRDLNEINILENKDDTDGYHEIYTELIRVCLYYGNVDTAIQLLNALKVVKSKGHRVQFLQQLINAQLILQKNFNEDFKDNFKGQNSQLQMFIQNRLEALEKTQSVFRLDKHIKDPWFIYEAAVQLWNISLPFMNSQYQLYIYKPLSTAIQFLEKTFCHDYKLRVQILYQLALIDYEQTNNQISANKNPLQRAKIFIEKAIDLDNYLQENELSEKLIFLSNRIKFQQGNFEEKNWKDLKRLSDQLDKLKQDKQQIQQLEIETIFKEICKFERYECQNNGFELDQKLKHFQLILYQQVSLIAQICFQEQFYDLLFQVIDFIFESKPLDNQFNKIMHVEMYYLKFQGCIQYLNDKHYNFAFEQNQRTKKKSKLPELQEEVINQKKAELIESIQKGIELAQEINQNWLVFNGAIQFWNNYLQYFKNSKFDNKLDKRIEPFLKNLISILKQCVREEENNKFFDFEIQQKIKIYANFCIIYTRFLETKNDFSEVQEVCEDLLQCALTDQTRKLINSIRARVLVNTQGTKQMSNKQNKDILNNNNSSLQLQILIEFEQLQNSSQCGTDEIVEPIQKCKDLIDQWIKEQGSSINDRIKSEICTKIANFCLNQKNKKCIKLAIQFLEISLNIKRDDKSKKNQFIIQLMCQAQFLYGKALYELLSLFNLSQQNKDDVCLKGLKFLLKATKNSLKCRDQKIFTDSIKKFYSFINWIKQNNLTDFILAILIKPIFTLLYYVKEARQIFQDIFGNENLQKLFVNLIYIFEMCCQITKEWGLLEKICFVLLEFLDKKYQDKIWHYLVIAMTKQEKSQSQIMNLIKDCHFELQAQLFVKISYYTEKPQKQYFAISKAIDILKQQQSMFIVEALMDLSEWMYRNDYNKQKITENLFFAIDIVIEKQFINRDQKNQAEKQILQKQTLYSFERRNKIEQKSYILDQDVSELDKLFRLRCYLSIIQNSTQDKIKHLNDSLLFIQNIHDLCQLYLDNINNNNKIKQNTSLQKIFQFKEKEEDQLIKKFKRNSNSSIFYKPLVSLQFIFYTIEQYESIGYDTATWICVSYLSFFNKIEFQSEELEYYCELKKLSIQDRLGFKQEIQIKDQQKKFDQKYFKNNLKYYCQNTINNINYKSFDDKDRLLNNLDSWVYWIKIAETFIELNQYEQAFEFLTNYQKVAQFQQKVYQVLESIKLQGIIKYKEKDYERANILFQEYLNKSKNSIENEDFIFYYLSNCNKNFNDQELLEAICQCEEFIKDQDSKNNIQIGYIIIFKCQLLLQNFKLFDNNFILETNETYQFNLKNIFQEIIGILFNKKNFIMQNFSIQILQKMIELLKQYNLTLKMVKILNFKILKQVFLLKNSLVKLLDNLIDNIQQFIIHDMLNLEELNVDHDLTYQIILESLNFLKCQQINELLQIEKFHQNNSITLPYLEQKSFASLLQVNSNINSEVSLFLIDKNIQPENLNKNEENWINMNIINLENCIQDKNYQELNKQLIRIEILHSRENQALLNIDVEEYCDINDNILPLLNQEKKIESQKSKEQTQVESHQQILNEIKQLEFQNFEQFNNYDYFSYNIKRLELLIKKQKVSNFENFINFQSLMFQKKIYDYSLQLTKNENFNQLNSDQKNLFKSNISLQAQNILKFQKFKDNIQNLDNDSIYFSLQFSSDFQLLYICCFYIDENFEIKFQKCKVYSANKNFKAEEEFYEKQIRDKERRIKQSKEQKEKINNNDVLNFNNKNNQELIDKENIVNRQNNFQENETLNQNIHLVNILQEIRSYYNSITQNNKQVKENMNMKYQSTFLQDIIKDCKFKNFSEVIKNFQIYLQKIFDSLNSSQKEEYEQNQKKNNNQYIEKTQFKSLWLLIDTCIIDFPIEIFIQEDIKNKFEYFSKESSIQALLIKKQQSEVKINNQNSLFLNLINKNVYDVDEMKNPIDQLKQNSNKVLEKSEDIKIDLIDCQNNLNDQNIFSFFSNYDFFDLFPIQDFMEIEKNHLKIIQIFDRQKVFDQEYFKYIVRKNQEFDYIRSQQFYFIFTLCQIQFFIYPRFYYTKSQFEKIINIINVSINEQVQFNEQLKQFDQFIDFNFIGYPIIQYDGKTNNKKK